MKSEYRVEKKRVSSYKKRVSSYKKRVSSKYRVIKTRIEGYKEETFQSYFRFVNKWSPYEKWGKIGRPF